MYMKPILNYILIGIDTTKKEKSPTINIQSSTH